MHSIPVSIVLVLVSTGRLRLPLLVCFVFLFYFYIHGYYMVWSGERESLLSWMFSLLCDLEQIANLSESQFHHLSDGDSNTCHTEFLRGFNAIICIAHRTAYGTLCYMC